MNDFHLSGKNIAPDAIIEKVPEALERAKEAARKRSDMQDEAAPRPEARVVDQLLSALSVRRDQAISEERELEVMRRTLSSVYDAMDEQILTEDEARALSKFMVSKYVERRLDTVLERLFELELPRQQSFQGMRGRIS